MNCKKCNYDNPDEAAFCGLCYEVLCSAPKRPVKMELRTSQFGELGDDVEIFEGVISPSLSLLLNALSDLFRSRPAVHAAYISHVGSRNNAEPPHPIIGLALSGDPGSVIQEAGWVVTQTAKQPVNIDFIPIGKDAYSQFLLMKTKPFYVK